MTTFRIAAIGAAAATIAVIAVVVGLALVDAGDDGGAEYRVHIFFNKKATQEDLLETQDILREYDPNADMAVLESFPPQGVAIVDLDDEDVCGTIVERLEAERYIGSADCRPYVPVDGEGDEPVSSDDE